MSRCRACHGDGLEGELELGPQPVASHFWSAAGEPPPVHELALGVCKRCALVQLLEPFPPEDLVPPHAWVTYREPEAHLDDVVAKVLTLPGVDGTGRALGLTFKDRTTLERLARQGFTNTAVLDVHGDLGADHPHANVETAQALLTPERARRLAARDGPARLLVVRHILEHANEPRRFLAALDALLAPGGYAIIEVPDCTGQLEQADYTMIWEEHVSYFTLETLRHTLALGGLDCVALDVHPLSSEQLLVLYARKPSAEPGARPRVAAPVLEREVSRFVGYASAFDTWTRRYRELLDARASDGRRLAAYGAGHLTCAFINFHRLAELFAFVVDDTPQKQGLRLPGTDLPIVARDRLAAEEIGLCLFGLSPDIEDKVVASNETFARAGGQFASMFANSPRSLRRLLAG